MTQGEAAHPLTADMRPPQESLVDRVLAVIGAELGLRAHPPTIDDNFEALGISHLDRVCIGCAIEETFDFELPDDVLDGWTNVAQVVATVQGRLGGRA